MPRTRTQTKLLDQPPHALAGANRGTLDRVVRTLAAELDVDYPTALQRYTEAERYGNEYLSTPETVRTVLTRTGVTELDRFAAELKQLEERDEHVTRTLEQGSGGEVQLDALGRVQLAAGFDLSAYRRDDVAQETRWRRAVELGVATADAPREQWAGEDMTYLEAGVDILETVALPRRAAGAARAAGETARALDDAIVSSREPAARARELDAAIADLRAERAALHVGPPAPAAKASTRSLKMLEAGELPTLSDLTVEQMETVLEIAVHQKVMTLDDAIASVVELEGTPPPRSAVPLVGVHHAEIPGVPGAGNGELDARIRAHQADHGCKDYLCGLQAVTGVGVGPHPRS